MHLTGYEGLIMDNVATKVFLKLDTNQIFAGETNVNISLNL